MGPTTPASSMAMKHMGADLRPVPTSAKDYSLREDLLTKCNMIDEFLTVSLTQTSSIERSLGLQQDPPKPAVDVVDDQSMRGLLVRLSTSINSLIDLRDRLINISRSIG